MQMRYFRDGFLSNSMALHVYHPLMTFSQMTELGASAIASIIYCGMISLLSEEMSIRACQDSVAMSHRTLYCLVESQSFSSLPDAFGIV